MRYIITQSQFHKLIYSYLDGQFTIGDFRKEINPYDRTGKTYSVKMFDDTGKELITYFWYPPGEDDDGVPHNGIGNVYIGKALIGTLKDIFVVRESKILDIIGDWVSERFEVDVDEVDAYER